MFSSLFNITELNSRVIARDIASLYADVCILYQASRHITSCVYAEYARYRIFSVKASWKPSAFSHKLVITQIPGME